MVKIIFLIIICLISSFGGSSALTNIECNFDFNGYTVVSSIYLCRTINNPNIITKDSAQISTVNGTHMRYKSNDDVHGFNAHSKTFQFFPKGLDKFFKNLKMIYLNSCQLKEIHQSDLKGFSNLINFHLSGNEIEVIEAGLFDFNPNLEYIAFDESKIVHIDPNVFDNLNELRYFLFSSVPCVGQKVLDSKENVQEAIKVIKSNCSNSKFLSLESQIKNLEIWDDLKNITDIFEDLKISKCGLKLHVDDLKTSQNEVQETLSEIMSLVTDYGSTQGTYLVNLKESHDEISKTLTELKADLDTKLDEKLEMFEQNLINLENLNERKIDELKKELDIGRYILSMSIDSKLQAVENRLMEKMERIVRALYIF